MTNGHDLGDLGFPMRPDRAAEDTWKRRLGCTCLFSLAGGIILAVVCGALGAVLW